MPVKDSFHPGTKKAPRGRGRPRSFDPDEALRRARAVFLRRGYVGATLDELCGAMGINRPSLYAAFGDKEALYRRVVEEFGEEAGAAMVAALGGAARLEAALLAFYGAALDVYLADARAPGGCLVMTTAVTEALAQPAVKAIVAEVLARIDAALAARLRRAREEGELAAEADPLRLARLAAAVLHSLAIRARAGTPRRTLERMAADAARLVAGAG